MFRIDRDRVQMIKPLDTERESEAGKEETLAELERLKTELENINEHREEAVEELRIFADDVRKKAGEMVDSAHEESARIKADAEAQSVQIKAQAELDGRAEGRRKAEAEADRIRAEMELARAAEAEDAALVIDEFRKARDRYFLSIEQEVVDLTLALAKKVTGTALDKYDSVFESMIKKALLDMRIEGKLSIRVSEEAYARFFSKGSASFLLGDSTVTAAVVSDPDLERFGCVIESDGETVDTGMETQFKFLELSFLEEK